jgi:hypothetical protein
MDTQTLTFRETGAQRLFDDAARHAEDACEVPDFGFGEAADGQDVRLLKSSIGGLFSVDGLCLNTLPS